MNVKSYLKRMFEGFIISLANIIPGVSGGTMALIMGIYERLVHAINDIPLKAPLYLVRGEREKVIEEIKGVDYPFLVPLLVGMSVSLIPLAHLMGFLIEAYTAPTYAFFFGLILVSVVVVYNYVEKLDIPNIVAGIGGFIFAFIFVGLSSIQNTHGPVSIFLAGALSVVSMILPGISGSFILVFLHQYQFMLDALTTFDIPVLFIFMSGSVIGLFSFAKFLDYLLTHYESHTMAFLVGLMLGALRVPVEKAFAVDPSPTEFILPAAFGAFIVALLETYYKSDELVRPF